MPSKYQALKDVVENTEENLKTEVITISKHILSAKTWEISSSKILVSIKKKSYEYQRSELTVVWQFQLRLLQFDKQVRA